MVIKLCTTICSGAITLLYSHQHNRNPIAKQV